jgi:hypothetical protein
MSEVLLHYEVIVYLLSETILYLLLLLAFLLTPTLIRDWDFDSFTKSQFRLENRSYLIMTIVLFIMLLKVFLLPYFVYTIDSLSGVVAGAMCGAGVIKANGYGNPLLMLKIIILTLGGLWITLNHFDLKSKSYPYIKLKLWLFIVIFTLLSLEFGLDILYFSHIDTTNPVTCCSVIFNQSSNTLPLGLDTPKLLMLFYLLFILVVLMSVMEIYIGVIISTILFLYISYYSVVYIFGTYIYELPTHKCPFCMLQSEYYFVGYLVWGLLLFGVFMSLNYAISRWFFGERSNYIKRLSIVALSLFVLLCSLFIILYYIKNGVFL